jgi:serine/threonine-protein kinase
MLARFGKEALTLTKLTHPSTVIIYDYSLGGEDDSPVIEMEYIDGPTLQQVVERDGRTPLPPKRVIHILKQLSGALAEAHRQRIIHRDVKPANIRLCEERGGIHDRVKLLDFGLVRNADVDTKHSVQGTWQYAPLEQIRQQSVLDKCDMYSVGAVACLLLMGRWHFEERNPIDIFEALDRNVKPDVKSYLGDEYTELGELVLACIDKDPALRPAAKDLEERLAVIESQVGIWRKEDAVRWWGRADPGPG